ncbi:aromatic ring-hydroxylating dioxygenase subunit alpha [Sphingobium sp. AN558]|uniref:aromatic ring-hydroxylating oxygenase subunit alpha n=1 Tax=Sphingobium sp. AN558 TaxID=3133442 RepID=UPI0030C643B6
MSKYSDAELYANYQDILDLVKRKDLTMADEIYKIPVSEYADRGIWEREVKLVRRTPMMLGFSCDLPEPGSYWAMTRVGVPLLLTRLKTGEVRLFINACRHRGVKVANEGQGKQPRFTCLYHAWTYGLDGSLLALPENRIFGDVDKCDYGLIELAVEERAGIIWGVLTPGVALDLDDFLGEELDAMLRKEGFERFHSVELVELPAANWKITYEGNGESYHFASLHAKSFASFTYPNILHNTKLGKHSLNMTPVVGIEKCDPSSRADLERFVQRSYMLFPGTVCSFASDTAFGERDSKSEVVSRIFMNHVLPGDSPETSITISRTLVSAPFVGTPIEEETRIWARSSHETVRLEDYPVVQSAQDTVHSGGQDYFTFGRNEIALHHFHDALHEALKDEALDA